MPDPETRLGVFHRHYGEDVLGAARSGDLGEARRLVQQWISANPPQNSDAWHPYVVSTRVGNWVAALTLLPDLSSREFDVSLWRQLLHLEANVEDELLGNHVLRNARGLAVGAATFGAPRLAARAEGLLRREVPEQILADGGHYERSPVYHLLVLRDLIEIQAVAGAGWLSGHIERMERFAAGMTRPDGHPALFNDGGLDLAPSLELPDPPSGLTVFPDTGYAVVRESGLWLALDCGRPCPPFLPAHAHADGLSFHLWLDGEPVVVDTGTSTYEPGDERDWLRSTAAHSTVEVDGASQFVPWAAFRAGSAPEVRLDSARANSLEARVVWRNGVTHLRELTWDKGVVVVRDRLEGQGFHRAASRLVLAPGRQTGLVASLDGAAVASERGLVAERFGQRKPTEVLVLSREGTLPLEFGWRISCA